MNTLYKHNAKILFYNGLGELALFPRALSPALLVLLKRCGTDLFSMVSGDWHATTKISLLTSKVHVQ